MNASLYWLHATTPLHVGSGQGIGFIDLPITREKVTNYPYVPGSSTKGVLRDACPLLNISAEDVKYLFGPNTTEITDASKAFAGALVLTDAHLLCLPVRSLFGTFAWISSPFCLRRLQRDLQAAAGKPPDSIPLPDADERILVVDGGVSKLADSNPDGARVYLEDLDFSCVEKDDVSKWAELISSRMMDADWQKLFRERFAIVSDNVFDFLCEVATEVRPRIRIDDETGTVAEHQFWYEEALPVESILAGLIWHDPPAGSKPGAGESQNKTPENPFEVLTRNASNKEGGILLQIGGKATTGKGQARLVI